MKQNNYNIKIKDNYEVPISVCEVESPNEIGSINPLIFNEILKCYAEKNRFMYFDYTPTKIVDKIPIAYFQKELIDDLAIVNPFDTSYSIVLFYKTIFSEIININNILKHFGYNFAKNNDIELILKELELYTDITSFRTNLLRFQDDAYVEYLLRKRLQYNDSFKSFWLKYIKPIFYLRNFRYNPFVLQNFCNNNSIPNAKYFILCLNNLTIFDSIWLSETALISYLHLLIETEDNCTLTLFIIDDDIDILNFHETIKTALVNYNRMFNGRIIIFKQKGNKAYNSNDFMFPTRTVSLEKCNIINQISQLRHGSKGDIVLKELYFITSNANKWENPELIEGLFKNDYDKLPKEYSYQNLQYNIISKEDEHVFPLGKIENFNII
jgi:hypothetical protein